MRTLNPSNLTAAQTPGSNIRVDFAEMIISSTDSLRLSTHYTDLTFDSNTYVAAGHLLVISQISDTVDVKQNSINVSLSGLDQTIIGQIAGADVRFLGSPITLYRGYVSGTTGALVADPFVVWRGIVNDYSTAYGGNIGQENTVIINVACKNEVVAIVETNTGRYTSQASFQDFNSTDRSMEFVPTLTDFNPRFGADT